MKILYVFGTEEARRAWHRGGHISPRCTRFESNGLVTDTLLGPGALDDAGGELRTATVGDRDSMRDLQGAYYDVVLLHPSFYPILQAQRDLGWDEFVRLCLLRR